MTELQRLVVAGTLTCALVIAAVTASRDTTNGQEQPSDRPQDAAATTQAAAQSPSPQKTSELAPTYPPIDSLKAQSPNEKHTGWWASENFTDHCIDSMSPSDVIKTAAIVKEPVSTEDYLDENGNIAGVTLTMPSKNAKFVFYRSQTDCLAKIQGDQRKVNDLASKYQ